MAQVSQTPGYEEGNVDVLGARVHYLHAGTGRPMLLIHGLVGSSSNWSGNIEVLAQHASIYAIDQGNMGRSQQIPQLDPGLEATADRIAATMTALGLEQADIVGHSHGGSVALMLAARHPHRVRSLVLFAPANPHNQSSNRIVRFYSTWAGRLIARAAPYLPTPLQRFALGRMYGDPSRIAADCLPKYIELLRVPGTVRHILAIVSCWFADMTKLKGVLPHLVDVPTLLVWGDRDRAVNLTSGISLNAELPASELVVVRGGGHVLFEELPEESNRILIDWLRRNVGSQPPRSASVASSTPLTQSRPTSLAARVAAAAMRRLSPET